MKKISKPAKPAPKHTADKRLDTAKLAKVAGGSAAAWGRI